MSRTRSIAPTWTLSVWFPREPGYRPEREFLLRALSPGLVALKLSRSLQVTGRRETAQKGPTSCSPAFPSLQGAFPVHFSLLGHTLSCCLGALGPPLLPQPEGALLSALDCGSSASCPDAVQGLGRSLLAKCLLQDLKGLSLLLRTHVEKLAGLVYT